MLRIPIIVDPGMSEDTAKRMAQLVKAVERSRAEDRPHKHRPVGEDLQAVIELAERFPLRDRREMRYPILKRLLARQG